MFFHVDPYLLIHNDIFQWQRGIKTATLLAMCTDHIFGFQN